MCFLLSFLMAKVKFNVMGFFQPWISKWRENFSHWAFTFILRNGHGERYDIYKYWVYRQRKHMKYVSFMTWSYCYTNIIWECFGIITCMGIRNCEDNSTNAFSSRQAYSKHQQSRLLLLMCLWRRVLKYFGISPNIYTL